LWPEAAAHGSRGGRAAAGLFELRVRRRSVRGHCHGLRPAGLRPAADLAQLLSVRQPGGRGAGSGPGAAVRYPRPGPAQRAAGAAAGTGGAGPAI
nr:hypothetical protein [Tanacetum cinerariifolium]